MPEAIKEPFPQTSPLDQQALLSGASDSPQQLGPVHTITWSLGSYRDAGVFCQLCSPPHGGCCAACWSPS
jgi:hypothetical protein